MEQVRVAFAARKFEEAERLCRQILLASPGDVDATLHLVDVLAATGRLEVARPLVRGILQHNPNQPGALVRQARFHRRDGNTVLALEAAERAFAAAPEDPDAGFTLAQCQLDEWQPNEAAATMAPLTRLEPPVPAYFELLGTALLAAGRPQEAVPPLQQAVTLQPQSGRYVASLVSALRQSARSSEAEDRFRAFLKEAWELPPLLYNLGQALAALNETAWAEQALQRAVERDPTGEPPRAAYGELLQVQGRFDEAIALYEDGSQRCPLKPANYTSIAFIRRAADDSLLKPMNELLARQDVSITDRQRLLYATAKVHEDLGEFEAAFRRYTEANELALSRLPSNAFDHQFHRELVDDLMAAVTPQRVGQAARRGNPSTLPVLITGMIRSGTTLTDRLLSSHPDVGAAGELGYLFDHAVHAVRAKGYGDLDALGDRYLAGLQHLQPGKARVTDKMPKNALVAGLAHLALPNARIVYCRRNPLDVCLSIYLTPYPQPLDYAHSFKNIAFYYREQERLVKHWREVLPSDRFIELDYEALVEAPEPMLRKLLDFVGLPWHSAVLGHGQNSGAIYTPSRWQARQAVYTSSVGRWERFRPWLGALFSEFPELKISA